MEGSGLRILAIVVVTSHHVTVSAWNWQGIRPIRLEGQVTSCAVVQQAGSIDGTKDNVLVASLCGIGGWP
jgi:hypothetical protein